MEKESTRPALEAQRSVEKIIRREESRHDFRGYKITARSYDHEWMDLEMSHWAHSALVVLAQHTRRDGRVSVSALQLAHWMRCSAPTARRALAELVELGLVAVASTTGQQLRVSWNCEHPLIRAAVGPEAADAVLGGFAGIPRTGSLDTPSNDDRAAALDALSYQLARQKAIRDGAPDTAELEGLRELGWSRLSAAQLDLLAFTMTHLSRVHRFGATQIADLVARAYLGCEGREGWLTRKGHPVDALADERQLSEVTRLVGRLVYKHREAAQSEQRKEAPAERVVERFRDPRLRAAAATFAAPPLAAAGGAS